MKKINKQHSLLILMLSLSLGSAVHAGDPDNDMRNDGDNVATSFDWQDEWGSIHMNSFADGLADPGHSGGKDLSGVVPCAMGDICTNSAVVGGGSQKVNLPTFSANQLFNGIKYDIKNSVNNCMARPSPNFPSGNGGWENPFSTFVCDGSGNDIPAPDYSRRGPTIIYSPIWDKRSNDERANSSDGVAGCIQQISNSCINDIYECHEHPIPHTRDTGWDHPVTHAFLSEEIDQLRNNGGLDGRALTRTIYRISKATSHGSWQNSKPSGKYVKKVVGANTQYASVNDSDIVRVLATKDDLPMQVYEGNNKLRRVIPVRDNALAGIKTYTIENPGSAVLANPKTVNGFIVVDPTDFFNLRDYIRGGRYDVGYNQLDGDGNPKTFDTCPILGLNTGYGGICDPTGKAGCNLPIYGVGNTTTKTAGGKTWESTPTPIIWSGYVKSWKFITQEKYLRETQSRKGPKDEELYIRNYTVEDDGYLETNLNDSVVLKAERDASYCDDLEFYDEEGKRGLSKCVQYFQFQRFDVPSMDNPEVTVTKWSFFNLFSPQMKAGFKGDRSFAYLHLFHQLVRTIDDPDNPGTPKTLPPIPYIYDSLDLYSPGMPISTTGGDGSGSDQMVPMWCKGDNTGVCGGRPGEIGNYVYRNGLDDGDKAILDTNGSKRLVSFMDKELPAGGSNGIMKRIKYDETRGTVDIETLSKSQIANMYAGGMGHKEVYGPLVKFHYDKDGEGTRNAPRGTTGESVIGNPLAGGGVALDLKPGTAVALRFRHLAGEERPEIDLATQFDTKCVIIANKSTASEGKGYFIPTNSRDEIDAFMNAGKSEDVNLSEPPSGLRRITDLNNGGQIIENWAVIERGPDQGKKVLRARRFLDKEGHEYLSFTACGANFAEKKHEKVLARFFDDDEFELNPAKGTATWYGQVSCNELTRKPACNQSQLISAQRVCLLSDGKPGNCEDCINAMNAAKDDGKITGVLDGKDDLVGLPNAYNDAIGGIVLASATDLRQCYFSALCLAKDSDGCPSAETSGGHVFCLSGDTKIEMADGSQKEIADIRDGEMVKAFSAKGSKSELISAKVVATTITENELFYNLKTKDAKGNVSTIKITGEHKVILSNGRGIAVQDLIENVFILDRNGKLARVLSVEESVERISVHNLILEEKADGYIAAGLRVQSYPLDSELKEAMQIK